MLDHNDKQYMIQGVNYQDMHEIEGASYYTHHGQINFYSNSAFFSQQQFASKHFMCPNGNVYMAKQLYKLHGTVDSCIDGQKN